MTKLIRIYTRKDNKHKILTFEEGGGLKNAVELHSPVPVPELFESEVFVGKVYIATEVKELYTDSKVWEAHYEELDTFKERNTISTEHNEVYGLSPLPEREREKITPLKRHEDDGVSRLPDAAEVVEKINEIIKYLNKE